MKRDVRILLLGEGEGRGGHGGGGASPAREGRAGTGIPGERTLLQSKAEGGWGARWSPRHWHDQGRDRARPWPQARGCHCHQPWL